MIFRRSYKVEPVENKLAQHKQEYLNQVRRMENISYAKATPYLIDL